MPTLENPGYYERSIEIAHGRYDHFFKWVSPDHCEDDTGSVECPIGWVGLVKVDYPLKRAYADEMHDTSFGDTPDSGWYIVRLDSNGLVWGIYYGFDYSFPEENARADFAEAEKVYNMWAADADSEEPESEPSGQLEKFVVTVQFSQSLEAPVKFTALSHDGAECVSETYTPDWSVGLGVTVEEFIRRRFPDYISPKRFSEVYSTNNDKGMNLAVCEIVYEV